MYQAIACAINARANCEKSDNAEWFERWTNTIDEYNSMLPSGSGIDSGTFVSLIESTGEKIVIVSSIHCMDDNGMYDGWIDFKVIVKPSLMHGIIMNIVGRFSERHNKYAHLVDYLHEVFYDALMQAIDE